jgi:hypothetical protein
LLTRSELPRVVCPRLTCREWLRDGEHGHPNFRKV